VRVQIPPSAPEVNRAGGSSSVVECLLAKEEVASSNLVFRSTCSELAELLVVSLRRELSRTLAEPLVVSLLNHAGVAE
jgi:hypothetical protein